MSKALSLDFRLNQPQFDAYSAIAPGRTVFTGFGRGVGKSWFHRFLWWKYVAEMDGRTRVIDSDGMLHRRKGVAIGVMMPTLKQFKDVHADGILDELDGPWSFLGGKYDKQSGKVTFPGGSTVIPFPAAEHTSKKARGPRVDIGSCDEVDDIPIEVYDGIMVPWMSAPWSLNIQILGGTPTRGRHGLWWRTLEMGRKGQRLRDGAKPEDLGIDPEDAEAFESVYSFHAWYKHAPETVSPRAVAKARATTPRATFEREWEANPDAGEGLVYPDFDTEFHVRAAPSRDTFSEFLIGIDHGDVDPGVMLLIGIKGHGNDATAWVLDEWYESACLNSVWDERLAAWDFGTAYPDPSRKDRIRDWRAQGRKVRDLPKEVKPIAAGTTRVADMLFRRVNEEHGDWCRLYVDPKCHNLIREFGLYRRKKHPDGTFSEEPEDKNNHCLVAGTMVTTLRGEVPIEDVSTSDLVMTRRGWRRVLRSWQSGKNAPTLTVTTSSGRGVQCTPEHRFFVQGQGWKPSSDLVAGDRLVQWENTGHLSPSGTTARSSAGTQIRTTPTLSPTGVAKMGGSCTGPFGSTSADQFRQATTSTMWTAIPSTTQSRTSSAWRRLITCLTTATIWTMGRLRHALRGCMPFAISRKSGTRAQRVAHGTQNTAAAYMQTSRTRSSSVSSVAPSTKPSGPTPPGSAQTHASPDTAAPPASMTSLGPVSIAAKGSGSTAIAGGDFATDTVRSVSVAPGLHDVFDLTVDGEHEFFANGILVHNSIDALRYAIAGRFGRVPSHRTTVSGS